MARLSVLLTHEQRHRLDRESAATGLTKSQVIARLLEAYMSQPTADREAFHAAHDSSHDRTPTST